MPGAESPSSSVFHHVTCPFCGLLCDDLTVQGKANELHVSQNGCAKAKTGFSRGVPAAFPRIDGKPSDLEDAVQRAVSLLRKARQPLYGGLATDVAGMRAVIALAERTGGVVDHMHGGAMRRNIQTLQELGLITTTLSEIRNRADLVVLLGTDAADYPRFFERTFGAEGLNGARPRELIFIGGKSPAKPAALAVTVKAQAIACDVHALGEVVLALRSVLRGQRLSCKEIAGIKKATLQALCERMREARYGVLVWDAARLDFPHSELVVQMLTELLRELNQFTRFAGFPLGGNEGATGATNVCAWLTGYPLRVGFSKCYPVYEPERFATRQMLASGDTEALVWIAAITPIPPPKSTVPTIVLGQPNLDLDPQPAVFFPVATPGLDHRGHLFRCDSVVSLPLQQLRASPFPAVATVIGAIEDAL
ncbi:MAG: formylmethanofuran dehydrogenase subunit B [Gammaproteobacteria bacterium]